MSTVKTAPNFVLYVRFTSIAQLFSDNEYEESDWQHVQTVTINLGWDKSHRAEPKASPTECLEAVRDVLDYLEEWRVRVKIIISPYLQADDHRYCFPKRRPQGVSQHTGFFKGIEFQSDCACEQGDTTGSKSGNCQQILPTTANSLPLNPELAQFGRHLRPQFVVN